MAAGHKKPEVKACGYCGSTDEPPDGWRLWRNLGWRFCNIGCSRRAARKVLTIEELRTVPYLQQPVADLPMSEYLRQLHES